jgi:hypothetical protein
MLIFIGLDQYVVIGNAEISLGVLAPAWSDPDPVLPLQMSPKLRVSNDSTFVTAASAALPMLDRASLQRDFASLKS